MAKERKGNLSEIAADYVRGEILSGKLEQKEKIVETEIAEHLGMSRGPVREALKQLMYEGFVDYEANKGCTVTLLSPKDAYEIFFLRGSLEKLALERCGGRLMSESLFLMEDAIIMMKAEQEEGSDMARIIELDEAFHRQILLSGQMKRLTNLWETLSPLNGAMFLTVQNINAYEKKHGIIYTEQEGMRRGNNYKVHKDLLSILREGNLERAKQEIDIHYLSTGERIYRIGIKMDNRDLFGGSGQMV